MRDVGVTAAKGGIGAAQSAIGLADLLTAVPQAVPRMAKATVDAISGGKSTRQIVDQLTTGHIGKAVEDAGVDLGGAQRYLDRQYSPAQQWANKRVSTADGFVDSGKEMLENPSTIATMVGESLPSMVMGGGLGRGVQLISKAVPAAAKYLTPMVSGAIGEGLVGAGSAQEGVREQSDTGLTTPGQTAMAAASGIGTSVFGLAGGRLARKFGVADPETVLAGGVLGDAAKKKTARDVAIDIVKGGISEGVFEELPQSVQEQVWQNAATGKPLLDGVGTAAISGILTGGAMGAGFNVSLPGGAEIDNSRFNHNTDKPKNTPVSEGRSVANQQVNQAVLALKEANLPAKTMAKMKGQPEALAAYGLTAEDIDVVLQDREDDISRAKQVLTNATYCGPMTKAAEQGLAVREAEAVMARRATRDRQEFTATAPPGTGESLAQIAQQAENADTEQQWREQAAAASLYNRRRNLPPEEDLGNPIHPSISSRAAAERSSFPAPAGPDTVTPGTGDAEKDIDTESSARDWQRQSVASRVYNQQRNLPAEEDLGNPYPSSIDTEARRKELVAKANDGEISDQEFDELRSLTIGGKGGKSSITGEGSSGDEAVGNADSAAHTQIVNTAPSEAQKKAGNYKKAHVKVDGMDVTIENPAGSKRSGTAPDGRTWETEMQADYGYIKGSQGHGKDHVDLFIAPGYQGGAQDVYVVNQFADNGKGGFDEHKVVVGAGSEKEAMDLYNSNYEAGWNGGKSVTRMPIEEFKAWAKSDGPKAGPLMRNNTKAERSSFTGTDKTDGLGLAHNLPKGTIAGGELEIGELHDEVVSGKLPGNEKRAVRFHIVTAKEAEALRTATGLDLEGYKHTVDSFGIRHSYKGHGDAAQEKKRGQLPVSANDFQRIPDIVTNYDSVEHTGKDAAGNDLILYRKDYNGETYYVEEVRKKRNELVSKTMWKTPTREQMSSSFDESSALTSETLGGNLPHPDKNIADVGRDGKTKEQQEGLAPQDEQTADTRAELASVLGEEGANKLFAAGAVRLIGSQEQAKRVISRAKKRGVKHSIRYSTNGRIQGFTYAGKVYLVSDGIGKGKAFSVLKHELGIHLRHGLMTNKDFVALTSSIEDRQNEDSETGGAIRAAMMRVPKSTRPEQYWEEVIAYMVEAHPDTSIVKKFIRIIKGLLRKIGLDIKSLTVDDINNLALAAVAREAGIVVQGRGTTAVAARQKDSSAPQPPQVDISSPGFKQWFGDWELASNLKLVKDFVQQVAAGKRPANVLIGSVGGKEAARIKHLTDRNVKGAGFELVANDISHALKAHGNARLEAKRNPPQEQLTVDDLSLLPILLREPTRIQPGTEQNGRLSVRFEKKINGTLVVVEIVPSAGGSLRFKTAWKRPSGRTDAVSPGHTPEAAPSPPHSYNERIGGSLHAPGESPVPSNTSDNAIPQGLYKNIDDYLQKSKPSVVVDAQGRPLVVREDPSSGGVFVKNSVAKQQGGAAAYLKITNPLTLRDVAESWRVSEEALLDKKQPRDILDENRAEVVAMMRDMGKDGIAFTDGRNDVYAVSSPTQVKSAEADAGSASDADTRNDHSLAEFQPVTDQMIRSPEFKRWFGRSVTKNASGRPVMLYHGSPATFFTFDDAKLGENTRSPLTGLGHFFALDPAEARGYAGPGGETHAFYVKVERSLVMHSWLLPTFDSAAEARAYARRQKELNGYDGIYLKDQGHLIAFGNTQVKSAETNTGDFDPEDPDVRYSMAEDDRRRQEVEEMLDRVIGAARTRIQENTQKRSVASGKGKQVLSTLLTATGNVSRAKVARKLGTYEQLIANLQNDRADLLETLPRILADPGFDISDEDLDQIARVSTLRRSVGAHQAWEIFTKSQSR
ncbi:MAG: hypothetical protein ACK5PS_08950 [Desulfopila sp.]